MPLRQRQKIQALLRAELGAGLVIRINIPDQYAKTVYEPVRISKEANRQLTGIALQTLYKRAFLSHLYRVF